MRANELNSDGAAALILAIVKGYSCQEAYKRIDGDKKQRNLTQKDWGRIHKMRQSGYKWADIAIAMDRLPGTLKKFYARKKKCKHE